MKTIFVLFIFIQFLSTIFANEEIKFNSVKRVINLKTQLVQITTDIEIVNNGMGTENKIIWSSDHFGNLSYINAENDEHKLEMWEHKYNDDELQYDIILLHPLKPMETVKIKVREVFTEALKAFPSEISQHDQQYFLYNGNCMLRTQYFVTKQTSQIILPDLIENFNPKNDFYKAENKIIQINPYENVTKFSYKPLMVHYVNNLNFIKIKNIKRTIEVSHWGNIAVEEKIEVIHSGAKLKGGFSRVEHLNLRDPNVITYIMTIIPISSTDVYYRDEIGNISTSYILDNVEYQQVIIKFRFPLYGGWKTKFTFGYNLPSYDYLFRSEDKYVLSIPVVYHVMHNMHIEHLETNVILPVNAKIIEQTFPYDVKLNLSNRIYQKFDQIGRQIIKIEKDNIINDHIKNLEIKYTWNSVMFLYEPFVIVLVLYMTFLSIIILLRLDFSLPSEDKLVKQLKQFKVKNRNQIKKNK